MKRILLPVLGIIAITASAAFFSGCGKGGERRREITVVSREESSGTRGAFDELMNITDGKTNMLFKEAIIVSSTDEAASKVEVDKFAISYTSLGSVTSRVRALSIGGVEPSEANVKSGAYKIYRPFVLIEKDGADMPIAADFLKFVASREGQGLVSKSGYVHTDTDEEYEPAKLAGKMTISGSTSVEKVIERLKEEYEKYNPGVKVEINYNGSSAGIRDCINGRSDLAVSSRELKETEKEQGLNSATFALDGIAIIVNQSNAITDIRAETVERVFKGQLRYWDEI